MRLRLGARARRLVAVPLALATTVLPAVAAEPSPGASSSAPAASTQPAASALAAAPEAPAVERAHVEATRVDLARGVAVVAEGEGALEPAWALATRVYRDPLLRPAGLDDTTARALAGEAPARATPKLAELADLRKALGGEGAASRRLLASLGAELGVSALLVVYVPAAGQRRARLYSVAAGAFARPELWPQPNPEGLPSWEAAAAWLHARAAASRASAGKKPAEPAKSPFASGWFWGAVGAAAALAIVAVIATRDETPSTIHLQGRVGP
jgi:hypothetical protein